jgi:pentatricopeptide repeat protein
VDADRVLRKLKSLQLTAAAAASAKEPLKAGDHPPHTGTPSEGSLEEVVLQLAHPSALALVPAEEKNENRNEKLANRAVIKYALAGDVASMMELLTAMDALGLTVTTRAGIRSIIKCATKAAEYSIANKVIDAALRQVDDDDDDASSSSDLKDVVRFDIFLWEAKVRVLSESGDATGALAVMEHLLKLGLLPTPAMYTSVLKSYVKLNRLEDAYAFWERMHDDNVDINGVAFAAMMQYCAKTDRAERAFFYFDEMREAYKVEPTIEVFLNLFAACATAPHFVAGYESFIFDAMILMEAAEMTPTKNVYDQVNIIVVISIIIVIIIIIIIMIIIIMIIIIMIIIIIIIMIIIIVMIIIIMIIIIIIIMIIIIMIIIIRSSGPSHRRETPSLLNTTTSRCDAKGKQWVIVDHSSSSS